MHQPTQPSDDGRSLLQVYLQEIDGVPVLSADEERELAERVAQGDPYARDHMVKANLRLVVNIARGYLGKGLCLEDLIEEGNLGLMRAVEGYDGTMETRFSTYASYWVKQSIRRAIMNNGKPIRLPAYMVSLLSKWKRAQAMLAERLGRTPTPDEIGKAMRLSKRKIGIVAEAIRVNNLSPHNETPSDKGPVLDDVVTDDRSKASEEQLIESEDLDRISEHIGSLDDREAMVIRMRFGLDSYNPMTLREVGESLGLTREQVRQLENQALTKLMALLDETGGRDGTADGLSSSGPGEPAQADLIADPCMEVNARGRSLRTHFHFDSFPAAAFPAATLFHDRREGRDQRADNPEGEANEPVPSEQKPERRPKKQRRRRIDPCTFEINYTDDELEIMNAMQRFKVRSGKAFPSHADVLEVIDSLGYYQVTTYGSPKSIEENLSDSLCAASPGTEGDAAGVVTGQSGGVCSEAEAEFMNAMMDYRRRSGRLFPTWSEVLEVLKLLGYQKHE